MEEKISADWLKIFRLFATLVRRYKVQLILMGNVEILFDFGCNPRIVVMFLIVNQPKLSKLTYTDKIHSTPPSGREIHIL